ncbi:MAG: hypothetical protein ACYDEA_13295 [Candidatus Dormibacteria bacterium]
MAEQPVSQRRAARIILTDNSGLTLLFHGGDPSRPHSTRQFPHLLASGALE